MALRILEYRPLEVKEDLNRDAYIQYLMQKIWPGQLDLMVVSPLERSILASGKLTIPFRISKTQYEIQVTPQGPSTSWKEAYLKLKATIELLVEGRNTEEINLEDREGFGYVISIKTIRERMAAYIEDKTAKPTENKVVWPRKRKEEDPTRRIVIPDIDYTKMTDETLSVGLRAKRFQSGIESELTTPFKDMNKLWMTKAVGYDNKNPPPKELSPIQRVRDIDRFLYVTIQLVRQETPEYETIFGLLDSELRQLENRANPELAKIYIVTSDGQVNVKRLEERLKHIVDANTSAIGRFEIVP